MRKALTHNSTLKEVYLYTQEPEFSSKTIANLRKIEEGHASLRKLRLESFVK